MTENDTIRAALWAVAAKNPDAKNIVQAIEDHITSGTDPAIIRHMLASLLTALGGADGR